MSFLDKMERKFGKYAIRNLMKYIVILYGVGYLLQIATPGVYETYFALNPARLLKGEVWRIFTMLLTPPSDNIIFVFITLYFYYMIGSVLERTWGSFKFNVYYFAGVIGTILAAIAVYLITGHNYSLGTMYINTSLFLAFAFEYPNMEVLLFFIMPIKMKYMAYISMVFYAIEFVFGGLDVRVSIAVSLLNFFLFFTSIIKKSGKTPSQVHRKVKYQKAVRTAAKTSAHHKCAVCGRTEEEFPDLTFRYCSKCNGNYEYCQDHLFTHQHVK